MNLRTVTYREALSVWWSMVWRAALAGIFAGFLGWYFGDLAARDFGQPQLGAAIGATFGWLASMLVGIWAIKAALCVKHNGLNVYLTDISPDTHVRCPDCRAFTPKQSWKCINCECKLEPS